MPRDKRRLVLGWGAGHQRPTAGLRVRMTRKEGLLHDRGVGTVVKVMAASGPTAQPACRVRWDDGSMGEYFSGMTVSRDAVARGCHPHYDTSALERWLDVVGWGQHGREVLSTCPIREILEMGAAELHKRVRPGRKLALFEGGSTKLAAQAVASEKVEGTSHARERAKALGQKQVRWFPSRHVQSEEDTPPQQQASTETRFTVRAFTPSAVTGAINRGCVHSGHWDRVQHQRSDGGDKIQIRLVASTDDHSSPRQLEKEVKVSDNGDGTYCCSFSIDMESAAALQAEAPRVLSHASHAHARLEVRINGRHVVGSPFPVAILGTGQRVTKEAHAPSESQQVTEETDDLEDFQAKTKVLHALCRQMLNAKLAASHRTRLLCHSTGTGHDFSWQGKGGSGSSLPLEVAS